MTDRNDGRTDVKTHMQEEILSQPGIWTECLAELSAGKTLHEICDQVPRDAGWLFIGCGSSYYLAQAAAATFAMLGLQARAVPASELLLFPKLALNTMPRSWVPMLISRSGKTSEILQSAGLIEREHGIRSLAITCSQGEPLETMARFTLHTLPADERSTVMTRSFSSMLLGLQYLGAMLAGNPGFAEGLKSLPAAVAPVLAEAHPRLRTFVAEHTFQDYVFLGQGPLLGIANESTLKITESSVSYAQSFHTMEFRHGPKSIVAPDTLVSFLLSESGYDAERDMLEEVKALGGTTMVVTNASDARTRKAADFLVELKLAVPETARLAAYVIWGQLLGLYTGLKKGLNPDEPRHLSRVVILDGNR